MAYNLINSYKTKATTGCSDPKNLKQAPQLSRKKMKLSQKAGIAQIDLSLRGQEPKSGATFAMHDFSLACYFLALRNLQLWLASTYQELIKS